MAVIPQQGAQIRLRSTPAWVAKALHGGMIKPQALGSIFFYYHEGMLPDTAALMAAHDGVLPRVYEEEEERQQQLESGRGAAH